MGRSLAFALRFCVIASAIATLLICAHAAHAQTASDSVYGFNAGQGVPQNQALGPTGSYGLNPLPPSNVPQPPPAYGYTSQPNYTLAQAQPPYGYNSTYYPSAPQTRPQIYGSTPQGYGYAPDRAYATTNYGTQSPSDPQAYYQPPDNGMGGSDYRLGSGDKIHVTVFGETDLSGDYDVDGSGMVRLPLIGTLRAAGATTQQLESAIGGTLAQGYLKNPRVNVAIVNYRPFYVVGAVNRPGNFPYVEHMNALNAVALAGGFTDKAKKSTVYVRHEGSTQEEEVPVDAFNRIRPGDVIRVDTTVFWDAMDIFAPLAPAAIAAAAVAP